jgi:ribosomal protein S27E
MDMNGQRKIFATIPPPPKQKIVHGTWWVEGRVEKKISFPKCSQQDATFLNSFISIKCSTCFRRFLRPSSGAQIVHTASGIVKH